MRELVITAIGPDRPGLVDDLTGFLAQRRVNIADSRMVNLHGQFAIMVLAEVPDDQAGTFEPDVTDAAKKIGLTVVVGRQEAKGQHLWGVPFRLRTYAMDQPGIVHRITHVLHQRSINIEELQTRLVAGSYSGTPLFSLDLRMTVPTDVQIKELRAELEALCDQLNCDMDLDPAE